MEYKAIDLLEEKSAAANYNPSEAERDVVKRVYTRFLDMQRERDKPRHEFDGRTLIQYVQDSQDAYNGIVSDEIKATKEDWQSLSWDHKTRGKVTTIVAMIIGAKPFMSITGKNRTSHKYANDMLDIYTDAWKQEMGDYKLFLKALDACIKGTVVTEEMYVEEKQKIKEITSIDQETGLIDFTEKEIIKGGAGKVMNEIVDLLQFYPNENSCEIEHDCCVVKEYTLKSFLNKYGKYPNADLIKQGNLQYDIVSNTYREITTKKNELIQVISYYNEDWDEYVILANNFWLNKQKGDKVGPIPFDHHKLPFSKTVFELADVKSFYGKSLPDLMSGEQNPTNALERLMIDREILSLNRGFILGAGVEIDNEELYPGAIRKLTGLPGTPLNQQVMEQSITGATQSGFQLLQLMKSNSDINTAINPVAQGVFSGRKSAMEANILNENAKRNAGPFQLHVYKLLHDEAVLRVENIKQFYTSPIQTTVLQDEYGEDVVTNDGETLPTGDTYRSVTVKKPGQDPKWLDISPKIKGCEFELRFIMDYEIPDSQQAREALAEKMLAEAKTNPLINADETTINWLESIRMNPDRFYLKPTPQAAQFQADNQGKVPPQNPGANMPAGAMPQPKEIPGAQVVQNKKIIGGVNRPIPQY